MVAAKQAGLQAFVTRGIVELESELGRLGVLLAVIESETSGPQDVETT